MEFQCRLSTPGGDILEGVYAAEDEVKLRRQLEGKGFYILSLRPRGLLNRPMLSLPQRQRVSTRDFIAFNQELAALLKAGMPLVQSIDILRQRTEHSVLKSVLDDVYDHVRAGTALSSAFEAHGSLFPGVYTASLLAGEQSGGLEEVLRRYVTYAQVVNSVRQRTISALIYPAILLCLSLLVVAIIVLRVTPEFAAFYASLGANLPTITRLILAVSEFIAQYAIVMVIALVSGGVLGWIWFQRKRRAAVIDRWLLRVPGVGRIIGKLATSQLARTLAMLLKGGLPLVNALDVAARSVGNRYFATALSTVSREVREGQSLSASMSGRDLFPPVAIKMIKVGESTGSMQEMLANVADFFDEEIETVLARFMTIIEPLLLVVMGIIIAGLLLALYMPLLQLGAIAS